MFPIKQGTTDPLLLAVESSDQGGLFERFDLAGAQAVTLLLTGKDQETTEIALEVVTPSEGKVKYSPAGEFLAAHSPYRATIRVTTAAGKFAYFPQGEPWLWKISLP